MLFPPLPTENLLPRDGCVHNFGVVTDNPERLYQQLLQTLPWQCDIVTVYGKTHITKRQMVWMGDEGVSYQYSGHRRVAIGWSPEVLAIKNQVKQCLLDRGFYADFNACLLNYYPTGLDSMGYHADDEPELGDQPMIASLSLGASRKFVFKHNTTKETVGLALESGQLILMRGDTQRYWKHSLAKTKSVSEGRISLTFRKIICL